ncbi:hypothetical protein A2995_00810 [Candidatus Nomurabacteria bacterium RIFCSPLOWO2_01_FULL_33_24]|uniref:Glycosyl transferase family 1 domain-containing protein n=1 Tax=Candidatus Nomurabacteria bacterium RIFCSPLOWO2_01_FULL_33_24 TaxID=1801765 RepID=A0A1F6X2X7_9BACT|nr:MAG: hypothetical protein A2995_00810 [Candidatus Nomurabacteria bacterium RIFCSPLOWO2_01_FULL_33_24]
MKALILYAYPPEPDGLSIQGHFLYKGFLENKEEATPCHPEAGLQKMWYLKNFKPNVSLGIGYWANTPIIVHDQQKYNTIPIPWYNADGWVANYHDTLNKLPLVLTTSDWVKQTYARDGVETKNFVPMHIGIDTNASKPLPQKEVQKVREMLGVKKDEKMILTIGGDVTSKGAQEMLQALAKIDQEFPKWRYICKTWPSDSAYGHHREEKALIEELGLDKKKITFLEGCYSQEFIPFLLNAADIYAAPSRLEGFGMLQVEAMACGKPVISIDAMGPKETIINGKTGFLAKVASTVNLEEEWVYPWMGFSEKKKIKFETPKVFAYRADTDDLARDTLNLLANDELREKMGKNAREHAVKNFHYTVTSKKIINLIKTRFDIS